MTKIMYLITIMITLEASDKSKFGKELLTNYLKTGVNRTLIWSGSAFEPEPDKSSGFL